MMSESLKAKAEAIRKTAGEDGSITASGVVEAATPPDSILHPEFEWEDVIAGHKYRLNQARTLIKRCNVVHEKVGDKWLHVSPVRESPSDSREGSYKRISAIITSQSDYDRALDELESKVRTTLRDVELLKSMKKRKPDDDQQLMDTIPLIKNSLKCALEGFKTLRQLH